MKNLGKPSFMYLLAKIHKTPLKTRGIISSSGSLCHGIATWLDVQLKKIIKYLPYVATSSATIVQDLTSRTWDPSTRLFTMDAVSMYTNIHLGHALPEILDFLEHSPLGKQIMDSEDIHLGQLEYTLDLVMKNNIFQFGDTFWLQTAGTAMGTPPAPNYATLYFAIHEYKTIDLFPEINFYRRYIDDGLGAWLKEPTNSEGQDTARWLAFQDAINGYGSLHEFFINDTRYHPLRWTFEDRSKTAIFLDLTIVLVNNRIETTIYEKKLNLYLYLSPHSCHPPGVLKGLIFGFAFRAKSLCTKPCDRMPFLRKCFYRLIARGYDSKKIKPIFLEAINRVLTPSSAVTTHQRHRKQTSTRDPLFFHLKFNPFDPRASAYQKIFQDTIVDPPGKPHISTIDTGNLFKGKPDFDRLITCFHGQRKLGSILAPRKHRFGANFSVSEFIKSHPLN